jgi:hypothetical protein
MRIWDLEVDRLCRVHLLAEHRELHGLWNILVHDKRGYRNHPETRRWDGRLAALYRRHEDEVREMRRRGWGHRSPLDEGLAAGTADVQTELVDTIPEQVANLRAKGCACLLDGAGSPAMAGRRGTT